MLSEEEKLKRSREACKKWKAKNPLQVKQTNRKWFEENREYARQRATDWREKNKDRYSDIQREYRKNNIAQYLYSKALARTKAKGTPFDLTITWVKKRLAPMICEATGIPLVYTLTDTGRPSPWVPSLDQIKPGKGYTKRNTQIVCWAYNAAKHNWDAEVLETLATAIVKRKKL